MKYILIANIQKLSKCKTDKIAFHRTILKAIKTNTITTIDLNNKASATMEAAERQSVGCEVTLINGSSLRGKALYSFSPNNYNFEFF